MADEIKPYYNPSRWVKGQSGNPNGRPKGAKDANGRLTKRIKAEIKKQQEELKAQQNAFLSENFGIETLDDARNILTPKEFLFFCLKLQQLVIPKEKDVSKTVDGEINININRTKKNDNLELKD